jgi:predicted GNAT family acetyltransferase
MDIAVTDDRTDDGSMGRYTLVVDGADVGELTWRMRGGHRAIDHTGVRDAYRNRGLAAELMKRAMDDARAEGVTVQPLCSYAVRYLEENDGYADLVRP